MDGLDINRATITSVSRLLKNQDISPVELIDSTFERIGQLDPLLKAFITTSYDHAITKAKKAENEIRRGQYRGPLHGIPFTLKDVIATKGIRTTYGHPRLHDFKPKQDATVRTLLEEAGAILVGKVYSQIGRGNGLIDCYNPWDITRSPGTSSSGSGSSVSASLGLLSLGTDTGGSVRHPASNCNLVGLRATFGRISRHGVLAPSWSFDQAGPLTKTVEDNMLASQVLARFDPKDPVSVNQPNEDYFANYKRSIKGIRIGVPVDRWLWEKESEEAEQLVRQAITILDKLGADIHEINIPLASETRKTHFAISLPESFTYWSEQFSTKILNDWAEIHPTLTQGKSHEFAKYMDGIQTAAKINQEIYSNFRRVDLIAMPTGSTINDSCDASTVILRGKSIPARSRAVYINGIASLAGLPAISVPCGFAVNNRLPLGMQLMGLPLTESLIYRVALAYENATDWHLQHPPISAPK